MRETTITHVYEVNNKLVVADTMEDAIRLYTMHYSLSDSESINNIRLIKSGSVTLNSDAIIEIK